MLVAMNRWARPLWRRHAALSWFAMMALACSSEPRPPHVVLISIDSLRPDHLSIYGSPRPTDAPLIDLFEEAVIFEDAISTSSWTVPAMASLITALLPKQHGVTKGRVASVKSNRPTEAEGQPALADSITTLAEYLGARGYATVAVSTNPHLSRELGFAQGIEHFERLQPPDPSGPRASLPDAVRANAAVYRLLEQIGPDEPVFLWIHYVDPHTPYHAREPWLGRYVDELGFPNTDLPVEASDIESFRRLPWDMQQKRKLMEAYYDAEVSYVMVQIKELLERLELGDEVIFVLTSDHGEAFYEHAYHGHSVYLYKEEIRIPLLIRFPGSGPRARRVPDTVSIVDVMPTLLDYLGIPIDPRVQGRSLLSLARGESDPTPVAVFGSLGRRKRKDYSFVRRGRWKLIRNHYTDENRLIDLENDAIEFGDVANRHPRVMAELLKLLAARHALPGPEPEHR